MNIFSHGIFILIQKNVFGQIFFQISYMSLKVLFCQFYQHGTFEPVHEMKINGNGNKKKYQ